VTAVTENLKSAVGGLPRLLPDRGNGPGWTSPEHDVRAHAERQGRIPYRDRRGMLIADIEAAGLTGRGGAAFPAGRKLRAVLAAADERHRTPVVIANGAESEPASEKDATLLWLSPHLVLDGLQLAAEAVGADTAILYTHADRENHVGRRLTAAIQAREAAGVDRVPVQLAQAPARFLAGQETALISHLSGGPAIPAFLPRRVTERGHNGAPTLVQNVETLAHLALIARYGPRWFRGVGTAAEPGSMLATVRRADGRPRIVEVPLGVPLRDLTGDVGPDQAVLLGGFHGTWLTGGQARGLTADNRSLARAQAKIGTGIVITLPHDRCGLAETARVARYLALESAGQCGPCLNGLPRIAAALSELADVSGVSNARHQALADIERWSGLVTGRGACHHPDGAVRFIRSALRTFSAEAGRHRSGRCSAGDRRPFLPVPDSTARTEQDWT
jgi:NADH:ubiquinone oxidoreductase subunit F (NADH-binding)